jgi:hypothetical protein
LVVILNIALENHPGSLAEVLGIFARAEINVDALEAEAQGDFGAAHIVCGKPKLAAELLRQDGFDVVEAEALELMVPNKYGEVQRICERLASNGVNVVSIFGTTPPASGVSGRVILRVNDVQKAKSLLSI